MITLDTITTEERAKLSVAAQFRKQGFSYIYEKMADGTGRQLDIWPFVLADWMSQRMMFSSDKNPAPEWDIIFAEAISGHKMQTGIMANERNRWHIAHTEFPEMFNHMKRYTPGEILIPR